MPSSAPRFAHCAVCSPPKGQGLGNGFGIAVLCLPALHVDQDGKLQIADIGMASVIDTIEDAHTGAVWSLAPLPDRSGFVSGAADKTVGKSLHQFILPHLSPGLESPPITELDRGKWGLSCTCCLESPAL